MWKFIYAFRDAAVNVFKGKIDFIILYGSAVRGEFVPGKSDVDIIFQVFHQSDKKIVEQKTTELFWKTANTYPDLQFEKSLSISKTKKSDGITAALKKLERSSFLYVPIFVFAKGEIDWERGELNSKNPLIKAGQSLLIPQRSVFLRFKQEGRILYGRDIRKTMKIKLTLADRLRLGIAPQFLSFIAFLLSPVATKKAMGYAVKALLYQIDSLITAVDEYQKMERAEKIKKSQKILLQDFTALLKKITRLQLDYRKGALRPCDFRLCTDAIKIKWGEKHLNYFQTIRFCLKANWFIIRSNARAVAYLIMRCFLRKKD